MEILSSASPIKDYVSKPRTTSTKSIIDAFIASGKEVAVVDIEALKMKRDNAYAKVLSYIKRHEDLKLTVKMESGQIVLRKI